jgi:membrane protease YdiL (CAAX protease family)
MRSFQVLLAGLWLALAIYTGVVIAQHGLNLLPIFFGDMARLAWPGQFNLDFLCLLTLSALWTAWRNAWSPLGLGLAVAAFFGGAGFLLPYLLILTLQTRGDIGAVLLGAERLARQTRR